MATHAWDTGNKDRDRTAFDELTEIAHRVQTFANASALTIGLRVGNTDEIVCCARSGPKADDVGAIMEIAAPFAQLCIQNGKGLLCEDTETDSRVDLSAVRALGVRSIVVSPVKQDNQVVAILAVFAPTANAFTGIHLAVMKTSADQIAAFLLKTHQKPEAERQPAPSLAPVAVSKPPAAVAEPKITPAPVIQTITVKPAPPAAPMSVAPAAAPISAVPVAVKPVVATRAVAPPPAAVAPTESKTSVREVSQRAAEPPASHWSGPPAVPAHPVFTPAPPRGKPVTTVLAEEVRPSAQEIKSATLPPAKEDRGGKPKQNRAIFTTLNSTAVQNQKPRSKMMMVSAAVFAVVAAGAAFAFVKARHAAPPVVAQRVQEAPTQPAPVLASAAPAANTSNTVPSPAPAMTVSPGANSPAVKPPAAAASAPVANNVTPAASAPSNAADNTKKPSKTEAKTSAPQPEKAAPETVALASGPSKITPTIPADNGPQDTGAAPTLAVGGNAALGKLSGLSGSSTSVKPSVMTQSKIEPAQAIKKVNPIYPLMATRGGIMNQDVVVIAHVGKDGKVASMRYMSGHSMLRDAAFAAVKQWQFKPATLNGEPIEQDQEIRFKATK